jgi:hypothetical protein
METPTSDAERAVFASWSEDDVDREVRRLCHVFSWRYYHSFLSIRSTKGFPDLCLVRAPRVVFAELKRQGGKLTGRRLVHDKQGYPRWIEGQEDWLRALAQCPGVETYVWMPDSLGEVATILDTGPVPGMRSVARVRALLEEE